MNNNNWLEQQLTLASKEVSGWEEWKQESLSYNTQRTPVEVSTEDESYNNKKATSVTR